MTIEWVDAAKAWKITADRAEADRLPRACLRWDNMRRCYWVPELAWALLEKTLGVQHQALFTRYHVPHEPTRETVAPTARPLLAHQFPAVSHLLRLERAGLFDDMGLCKTASVLAAYNTLKQRIPDLRLLVLCPKRVLSEWANEVRATLGRDPLPEEQFFNYDKVWREKWALGLIGFVATAPTVLVLDECHVTAGVESRRFLAVEGLARRARFLWALSGTPVRNKPESFFPIYRLISNATANSDDFRTIYCQTVMGRIVGYKRLDQLEAVTRQYCLRREAQNVITLPPLTEQRLEVELAGRQKAMYKSLADALRKRVRAMTHGEYTATSSDVRVQLNAMLMAASHPVLIDPDADDEDCEKIKVIDELLAESGDQKVLIWSRYPRVLERIAAHCRLHQVQAVTMHGANSDKLNEQNKQTFLTDPAVKVCCLSIGAMGEGLNLQVASIAIYHDLYWTYDKFHQSQRRLWRTGQTKPVHIYYLVGKNTIENYVLDTLKSKEQYQQAVTGRGDENIKQEELLRILKG